MFDTIDTIVTEKAERSLVTFTEGMLADAMEPDLNPNKLIWNMTKQATIACNLMALSCSTMIAANAEKKINCLLKK